MRYTLDTMRTVEPPRLHYFAQATMALLRIHECGASGRLSLRNEARLGIAHLYFREALLVHVVGDKRGGENVLRDVLTWTQARVRFDWDVVGAHRCVSWQEAELFSRWLSLLEIQGVAHGVPPTMAEGLETRLAAYLLQQSAKLPALTAPLRSQKAMLVHSSADWPTPVATPVPPQAGLVEHKMQPQDRSALQHLPVTPQPSMMQDERVTRKQSTGVMLAVGRVANSITRKMASIKLPGH